MEIKDLELKANLIRQDLIKMLVEAGSGHSAGPLGMADLFTALYFANRDEQNNSSSFGNKLLRYDPQNPNWEDRDRLILSCGHTCPILYTTLIHAGILKKEDLLTLRKFGTRLQGHPHHEQEYAGEQLKHENTPGVENSSGPLGQGTSVAVGMALAAKMDGKKHKIYLVGSDGELQEGQVWEALMFAGNHGLGNLIYLIDRNNIQIDGYTEKINGLEPLAAKLKAFNFHVAQVNGHSFDEIISTIKAAWAISSGPKAIIVNTIPGKGVEFMEGDFAWHGKPPSHEQGEEGLKELRTLQGKIQSEHQ